MVEIPGSNKASSSFIGTELSADIRWQVDFHLQLGAILAELYTGPALTEIKGKDLIYAVAFAKYKF
jgi:hypothetical protein